MRTDPTAKTLADALTQAAHLRDLLPDLVLTGMGSTIMLNRLRALLAAPDAMLDPQTIRDELAILVANAAQIVSEGQQDVEIPNETGGISCGAVLTPAATVWGRAATHATALDTALIGLAARLMAEDLLAERRQAQA